MSVALPVLVIAGILCYIKGRESPLACFFLFSTNAVSIAFSGQIDDIYFYIFYCYASITCYFFSSKHNFNSSGAYFLFAFAYFSLSAEDLIIDKGLIDRYYYFIMYSLTFLLAGLANDDTRNAGNNRKPGFFGFGNRKNCA